MSVNYIKTLKLTLDADAAGAGTPLEVECQLTNAQIVCDTSAGAETLTTFCGSQDVPGSSKYTLHLAGFQDWGSADAIADLIHKAFLAGQDTDPATLDLIDYVLTVGKATRTGQCRPQNDVTFGGDAGAALTFDVDLACTGAPTDGVVTP